MAVKGTGDPVRVVIVDDDAMVRTGLRMILGGDPGLQIVGEAADGRAGLRVIAEQSPDVVLLDVRMPVLDGLGVTERLSEQHSRVAVIILTTFNSDDYVLRTLRAGARGFLLKDTAPPEMIAAIHRAARGEPVLSPEVTDQVIAAATAGGADAAARRDLGTLTGREREVAALLAAGSSNQEIASALYMSLATVKANVTRIFMKLGVDNRVAAAMRIRDGGGLSAPRGDQ